MDGSNHQFEIPLTERGKLERKNMYNAVKFLFLLESFTCPNNFTKKLSKNTFKN